MTGPSWRGSPGPSMSLYPAGSPAGRGVAGTVASVIGAAVAAWLGDHREILDMAGQAHAAAARARAQRDLELLHAEIAAARQHLDELHRKQDQLRMIAASGPGGPPDVPASPPAATRQEAMFCAVAGVPVDIKVAGGELAITVWRYDLAAAGQLSIDLRFRTATLVVAVADETGGTARPGQRSYFDLHADPGTTGSLPGQEAQQ